MKNPFLYLLLFIGLPYASVAQYSFKNSYKLGVSYIFFGTGDLTGLNFLGEYNRKLSNHITFSPSIQYGYGKRAFYRKKESTAVNAHLFASPMPFDKNKFRLGLGPSVRYTTGNVGLTVVRGQIRSGSSVSVGYSIVVEGEFNPMPPFLFGVGGGMQSYANGERIWYFGLNGGYKF